VYKAYKFHYLTMKDFVSRFANFVTVSLANTALRRNINIIDPFLLNLYVF